MVIFSANVIELRSFSTRSLPFGASGGELALDDGAEVPAPAEALTAQAATTAAPTRSATRTLLFGRRIILLYFPAVCSLLLFKASARSSRACHGSGPETGPLLVKFMIASVLVS
jgi:hypothetical protein